ncbi:MAG: uncharacterized protein PWP23_2173 [Candidatus Sumerlaeota bacterium]|nr:uncharacterized protein [Candidatus Sumerlaeota bacterium]
MNDLGGKSYPFEGELNEDDKQMGMLAHMLGILGIIPPLIIWAIKKDQSEFVKQAGMHSMFFQIALLILWIITSVLSMVCIGFLLMPIVLALQIAYPIVAGLRAKDGICYEYPVTSKFVK